MGWFGHFGQSSRRGLRGANLRHIFVLFQRVWHRMILGWWLPLLDLPSRLPEPLGWLWDDWRPLSTPSQKTILQPDVTKCKYSQAFCSFMSQNDNIYKGFAARRHKAIVFTMIWQRLCTKWQYSQCFCSTMPQYDGIYNEFAARCHKLWTWEPWLQRGGFHFHGMIMGWWTLRFVCVWST